MLSQMNKANHTGRAIILLAKRHCKNIILNGSQMTTTTTTVLTAQAKDGFNISTTSSNDEEGTDAEIKDNKANGFASSLDNRVSMYLLRQTFTRPGPGLKKASNRDNLVLDFFNLSKSVIEGELDVADFVSSDTFNNLQEQLELNIDVINNSQLVSLLASVIKMRIVPSKPFVKLLEHEVKFRLKLFNLNQLIKMIKFYNSTEITSEQTQLVDSMVYRLRSYIQDEATSLKELNSVLHLISSKQVPHSLIALVEERLLSILAINQPNDEDDIVSQFLEKQELYDYDTLCKTIIYLAELKRRPAPLLKAASIELCRISRLVDKEKALPETIIMTLDALVGLSYPNKTLVGRLISDLSATIKLDEIDSYTLCNLLRSIGALRWRPVELLEMFFNHVKCHNDNTKMIDHHVIVALLHVVGLVNYKPKEVDLKEFYNNHMKGTREEQLNRQSRKWLTYVWTLVQLNLAEEWHIRSVLSKQLYEGADYSSSLISHSDAMKLLNLRAIAHYELRMDQLDCDHLDGLKKRKIQRSGDMQRLADKVGEALKGIVGDANTNLRQDIQTPFGFTIDCELMLDDKLKPIPLDKMDLFELCKEGFPMRKATERRSRRCALIYTSFEEIVANSGQSEVVGHKLMISRILKAFSYETIFLLETKLNREKTTADLCLKLESLIRETFEGTSSSSTA